jgi:hypothetical protein
MATVLSGTSGALYYKPAGTYSTFVEADVSVAGDEITVGTYLNFKVGDKVQFSLEDGSGGAGTGTLPAGLSTATDYYVIAYTASTGVLQVSATSGGTTVTITDDGTLSGSNVFAVRYEGFQSVANVRSWNFEITREELDTTTIGGTLGQTAPFRTFISGFADGSGSAEVYFTDDDTGISARLIEDVTQRKQAGATFKLYMDTILSSGTPDDTKSRSIELEAVLTSASYAVSPDDAQVVSINFRPTKAPTFDFSKS